MKVLMANSERKLRGGELQTIALAQGLRERGCEVMIAARSDGALLKRAGEGMPCEPFRFEAAPLRTPRALAALIARWRPNILHAQTSAAHTHLWIARKLVPNAPPLVVSRRVAFAIRRDPFSLLKYRSGVAHYIPISRAAARSLTSIGIPSSRMTIVPSGIDVARFQGSRGDGGLLKRWGIGEETTVIGSVGAFEREKGHRILVGAAPLILESHPEARFVLVGEGRLRRSLDRAVLSLGLKGKVVCVDERAPLETVIPLFDVFVLPSLQEGLSTVVLAAMAAGVPVVASDVGGVPDAVTPQCGILVPPGDRAEIAGAVVKIMEDESLRGRLGAAARERSRLFDIGITVEKVFEVYRRMLEGGGAGKPG